MLRCSPVTCTLGDDCHSVHYQLEEKMYVMDVQISTCIFEKLCIEHLDLRLCVSVCLAPRSLDLPWGVGCSYSNIISHNQSILASSTVSYAPCRVVSICTAYIQDDPPS